MQLPSPLAVTKKFLKAFGGPVTLKVKPSAAGKPGSENSAPCEYPDRISLPVVALVTFQSMLPDASSVANETSYVLPVRTPGSITSIRACPSLVPAEWVISI